MRWPLRRKPAGRRDRNGVLRADRTRIALLEHDVFGIPPAPGSAAEALLGVEEMGRRLKEAMAMPVDRKTCRHEDVVETPALGEARMAGVCVRCGAQAVEGDDGQWTFPGLDDPR
jgi:hypothetical protein